MKNIENILKPKSHDEIKKILCDELDLEMDENIESIEKLFSIVNIKKSLHSQNTIFYLDFNIIESEEEEDAAMTPLLEHLLITRTVIKAELMSKNIKFTKKITDWNKVYRKVIRTMIKNAATPILDSAWDKNIYMRIQFCANMIAVSSRVGPGNFALMNEKTFNLLKQTQINNVKLIIENSLKNGQILVGRRSKDNEPGIHLIKYKNKYEICLLGNVENFYICT